MSTEFLSGKTKFFPDFQKLIGGHGARPLRARGPCHSNARMSAAGNTSFWGPLLGPFAEGPGGPGFWGPLLGSLR